MRRIIKDTDPWPCGVSDGLTIPCCDCGEVPLFDYKVTNEFWWRYVPDEPARLGVVCLPCLNRRAGGAALAEALQEVQWTGIGHTVVLTPTARFIHGRTPDSLQGVETHVITLIERLRQRLEERDEAKREALAHWAEFCGMPSPDASPPSD